MISWNWLIKIKFGILRWNSVQTVKMIKHYNLLNIRRSKLVTFSILALSESLHHNPTLLKFINFGKYPTRDPPVLFKTFLQQRLVEVEEIKSNRYRYRHNANCANWILYNPPLNLCRVLLVACIKPTSSKLNVKICELWKISHGKLLIEFVIVNRVLKKILLNEHKYHYTIEAPKLWWYRLRILMK